MDSTGRFPKGIVGRPNEGGGGGRCIQRHGFDIEMPDGNNDRGPDESSVT